MQLNGHKIHPNIYGKSWDRGTGSIRSKKSYHRFKIVMLKCYWVLKVILSLLPVPLYLLMIWAICSRLRSDISISCRSANIMTKPVCTALKHRLGSQQWLLNTRQLGLPTYSLIETICSYNGWFHFLKSVTAVKLVEATLEDKPNVKEPNRDDNADEKQSEVQPEF